MLSDAKTDEPMATQELTSLVKRSMPQHIAIIMDGNGRWAQAQGKPRVAGHKAGVKAVRRIVSKARELGIKSLTLFAFSSENWRRPDSEVSLLMQLFMTVLRREIKLLHSNGVRLNIIGDTSRFSPRLQQQITSAEEKTAENSGLILNVAANYGGRWDIFQASKKLAQQVESGQLRSDQLTESSLSSLLMMQGQSDVDLMIRTGGDFRISNFVLWQAAYAELVFTEKLWPDFDEEALELAISQYSTRQRRFGLTGGQVESIQAEK